MCWDHISPDCIPCRDIKARHSINWIIQHGCDWLWLWSNAAWRLHFHAQTTLNNHSWTYFQLFACTDVAVPSQFPRIAFSWLNKPYQRCIPWTCLMNFSLTPLVLKVVRCEVKLVWEIPCTSYSAWEVSFRRPTVWIFAGYTKWSSFCTHFCGFWNWATWFHFVSKRDLLTTWMRPIGPTTRNAGGLDQSIPHIIIHSWTTCLPFISMWNAWRLEVECAISHGLVDWWWCLPDSRKCYSPFAGCWVRGRFWGSLHFIGTGWFPPSCEYAINSPPSILHVQVCLHPRINACMRPDITREITLFTISVFLTDVMGFQWSIRRISNHWGVACLRVIKMTCFGCR